MTNEEWQASLKKQLEQAAKLHEMPSKDAPELRRQWAHEMAIRNGWLPPDPPTREPGSDG